MLIFLAACFLLTIIVPTPVAWTITVVALAVVARTYYLRRITK